MSRLWLVIVTAFVAVGLPSAEAQVTSFSVAASRVATKLAEAFPKVRGVIVSIDQDGKLIVDLTKEQGVYPGLEMEIFREGEPFKHPVTGEVMGRLDKRVAFLKVVEVRERFSVGQLLDQERSVKQGDGVRVTGARILIGLAKVDSPAAGEMVERILAREVEGALKKTGRFEVIDERLMRSTLVKAKLKEDTTFTDPAALEVLRRELRLSGVALVKLGASAEGSQEVDVELISTRTGSPVTVVSAEVPTTVAATKSQGPEAGTPAPAAPRPAASTANREQGAFPAWLGPPNPESSTVNPHFTENPYFGLKGRIGAGGQPSYFIQPVPPGLKRIAFGDLDGDGQDEMVGITDNKVMVFRWTGRSMALKKTWVGTEMDNYLLVDVADINHNGRAEIFVSNMDSRQMSSAIWSTELKSFVLELKGENLDQEELVPIWENVPLWFRVLKYPQHPEGILLTQPTGRYDTFAGSIRRYVWGEQGYVPDPEWVFPSKSGLRIDSLALVDLTGNGEEEFVILGNDGLIRVGDQDGKKLAQTNEPLGYYDHLSFEQELNFLDVVYDSDSPRMDDRISERSIQRIAPGRTVCVIREQVSHYDSATHLRNACTIRPDLQAQSPRQAALRPEPISDGDRADGRPPDHAILSPAP
ncbi:MAG: VCBS repeat-containing protein [candidate division NC10 bacterium]|nr:VCBS repeat-containing protein [candidate division NC10 bacterium]